MRGLEEIIHENNKIVQELKAEVSELEIKKRKLEEQLSDLEWRIDAMRASERIDW